MQTFFRAISALRTTVTRFSLAAAACGVGFAHADGPGDKFWPQWRGPLANGVAPHAKPPTEWSETKNVRWKVEIPGEGLATPVVWGDRIYLLAAIKEPSASEKPQTLSPTGGGTIDVTLAPGASIDGAILALMQQENPPQNPPAEGRPRQDRPGRGEGRPGGGGRGARPAPTDKYRFAVLALDRKTGKTVWETTVCEKTPHETVHPDSTQASPSPITDGEHIFAYFGSRGLHCLDMNGKIVWQKDFGQMRTRNNFGEGASPALHGDALVVTWDHEGDDFIAAFNKKTGDELWRVTRDEPTTWSTPLIVEVGGTMQVIASGTNKIIGYDLKTGKQIWECGGLTQNVIPSPVYADGLLIAVSGFRGAAAKAIRLSAAKGDISDSKDAIVWTYEANTPYVPSPLLAGGLLYFYDNNRPILTCLDAKTGEKKFGPERLDAMNGAYASPIEAAGHVYLVGRNGKSLVLKLGPELKVVATNELDDNFDSSPVAVDDVLYLRGRKNLYCIGQ